MDSWEVCGGSVHQDVTKAASRQCKQAMQSLSTTGSSCSILAVGMVTAEITHEQQVEKIVISSLLLSPPLPKIGQMLPDF